MLTPEAEREIADLGRRFGPPARSQVEYKVAPEKADWLRKMLNRQGEVVLVVPNEKGRIWLHTKPFYPGSVYRLPSGGIDDGESIENAAHRETYEEMGFEPEMARFLGVIENVFILGADRTVYPTYVFETKPTPVYPRVLDPHEAISGFRDVDIRELPSIVEQLDSLGTNWQPWGHFRAAPHALVIHSKINQD